ncbi:hypothetical protein QBC35DRAFT_190630 [Podospora australis]|uniref:Protein kinase domain-containing protein n=1 Tax=Podospora australis TaxID=1536484 RepID=A0AAN7AKA2_9PEZI|nr:hypothetical protein QBC35DRAFT_190630 [Podospora australis]
MESYNVQPAFQRRLSRLYNDTKRRSEFVKEPVQHTEADPDVKSLHRKLRIQKDRFVSWGLEWSDPNQSAEVLIDSSLTKAGLSDVVGSIMATIKDILAEAEPLWNSSRSLAGENVDPAPEPPRRGEKIRMVVWDKNKFEDLVRDLTTAVDTLYDLSRMRASSAGAVRGPKPPSAPTEDLRPFESSRIQTPQQIDPKTLKNLREVQAVPMTEKAENQDRVHEIVFMDRQAYAELTRTTAGARQTHSPLLLEYASFDSIYSITGISPPLARFEKLSAGLQAESTRAPGTWTGLPRLLGYFEDMDHSRFGLVYQFPRTFNPVTFEHLTQNPLYNLCTLADLLARPDFEPKLEAKFRLAANLANTVFDMHARGITHGSIGDGNVSFCNAVGTDPEVSGITQGEVDIRRPLISSFDLFSDPQSPDEPRTFSLYKHPLDPRNSAQSPLTGNADSKTFDLYSLAMILLSIGLWTNLENLVPNMESPTIPEAVLEQLAIRCGSLYMKAVQTCWNAVDQEMQGRLTTEQIVSRVEYKTSRYLEACCILDGVSSLEERLGDDLGDVRPEPARLSTASVPGPSKDAAESEKAAAPADITAAQAQTDTTEGPAKPKMRLFPHVSLPQDVVERWDKVIMKQVEGALRHFYRKNPETVEISLQAIGPSAQQTKPTVLVVCTSVGKVKAILKKKLGDLFEGTAGFGLKVCSGRMVRSRKEVIGRSMAAGLDEVMATNPDHQERPLNGASLGAWVGDRHLPPVSLGGIITVDDREFGMTVHHMLDDPDLNPRDSGNGGAPRSMAGPKGMTDLHAWYAQQYQNTSESELDSSGAEDYACEFSDSESEQGSAITSEYSDEDDEEDEEKQHWSDDESEPGDIPGIEPGCGEGYIITQPALDDIPDEFYPCPETQDEDHLDTYTVGEMYASSGIKRRRDDGLVHEIDWALFDFSDDRYPPGNIIPSVSEEATEICPTTIAPSSSLPGMNVQCMARTSGLQTGTILQGLVSVKIYGRETPSHTYQLAGTRPPPGEIIHPKQSSLPVGMPGDSGAWVVDREQGRLCGHILAWSERKRVAYICPMDVLILDIAETLEANEIKLPGGEVIFSRDGVMEGHPVRTLTQRSVRSDMSGAQGSEGDNGDDEGDEVPSLVGKRFSGARRHSSRRSQKSAATHRASYLSARRQSTQTVGEEYDSGVQDVADPSGLGNALKAMGLGPENQPSDDMMRRWGYV